jgi:isoquinoline 1-oxidoreductase beta subunit
MSADTPQRYSRRDFLAVSATVSGGLMLGFHLPAKTAEGLSAGSASSAGAMPADFVGDHMAGNGAEINAWLVINHDDSIVIRVAQAEMGQGVYTALPMILAEELEVDWRRVSAEYASARRNVLEGDVYQRMATGGSQAVSHSRVYLQQAGAEARERLIKAAAEQWHVDPSTCVADYGRVHHRSTGQSINYGAIAGAAAQVSVANVSIKQPAQFGLLGVPKRRLDVPAKVDGSAVFGIDVRLPGMLYAAVTHCPVLGGSLRGYRFNSVREMPGVVQAVRLDAAVAIVASTWWQASKAVEALPVDWEIGDAGKSSSELMRKEFIAALDLPGASVKKVGNAMQAMQDSQTSIESDYILPYLSHSCLEPLNCTVWIQPERVDVWGGFQDPEAVLRLAASLTRRELAQVHVHNCHLGGSFGRRSHTDYVAEAVQIALQASAPVQMIWRREEDSRQGRYRPMAAIRFKAGFNMARELIAYTNHSVSPSILQEAHPDAVKAGVDPTSVVGLLNMPYAVAHQQITHTIKNTHLTSWYWRSVGASQNVFAMECFTDEMAAAAGQDPLTFRRALLRGQSAKLKVLAQLAQVTDWGKRMPDGSAQGMALYESAGTIVGMVAEVYLSDQGELAVQRIISVVDCGNLVNPLTAEEQIESSVLFGLTATLYGNLTVENGRILEDNFDTQAIIRMNETPVIETHWALSGGDHWGGLGEPATPCVAPAVCNALYQLTARRMRSLPLKDYYLQRRSR